MRLTARLAAWATLLVPIVSPALAHAADPTPARAAVQHLLHRFAFSAPPEAVTAIAAAGPQAWLAAQLAPQTLDDSGTTLETLPTSLNAQGGLDDYDIFERAVLQHMLLTPRQLQAKLELHWLDHFAVGLGKVGDPALMYHYDQTIRANALGNFATLLTQVAREPAMLAWLDNNYNVGSAANENFARECMQLYALGLVQLNPDGSPVLGSTGQPLPAYTQADVVELARAITGYGVIYNSANTNPQTRFSVGYFPANHYAGSIRLFGALRTVPADGTALDAMMALLARRPSVAPFMARELLQRFATETPSPGFIADIAAVWRATQDAPDQIAQVMAAIASHPEFAAAAHAMPKQPVELVLGALRQTGAALQAGSATPGDVELWELANLGQRPFFPLSVFSFYRPGNLSALTNTGTVLARTSAFANLTGGESGNPYTDATIDLVALRARIGSTAGTAIADDLLDALVDGGTPALRHVLRGYLGDTPSDARLRGAIWLLLDSPDFTVN